MYDSMYSGDDLIPSLTHQLALIYRGLITKEEDGEDVDPQLVVYISPVQQQKEAEVVVSTLLLLRYMLLLEIT